MGTDEIKQKAAEEKSAEQKSAEQKAPKPEESKPKPSKPQKPANCPVCNKSIKEKWYYREGAYYCGKRYWKQAKTKAEEDRKKSEEQKKPEASA